MQHEALPGWKFIPHGDLFQTIEVVAPNGYSATLSSTERNPANVFYLLVRTLLENDHESPRKS